MKAKRFHHQETDDSDSDDYVQPYVTDRQILGEGDQDDDENDETSQTRTLATDAVENHKKVAAKSSNEEKITKMLNVQRAIKPMSQPISKKTKTPTDKERRRCIEARKKR